MFKITGGKGFHITFENGYTVSVQFRDGTCSEHGEAILMETVEAIKNPSATFTSKTAECAVWKNGGDFIKHFDGETISSHSTAEEVLELLSWAAAQKE